MQSIVFPIIVKALSGTEEILARELLALGITVKQSGHRVVFCEGDLHDVYRINLLSRLAGKVLIEMVHCRVHTVEDVYKQTTKINWSDYFDVSKTIAVDASIHQNRNFRNSMYAAQLIKDGVVDSFRRTSGKRPSVSPRDPDIRINVHIDRQQLTLSLDSSGEPLHKRGYRQDTGIAPINEILAAALLHLCEWDGESKLVDPMCGSGTIVIEAAMMASKIPPGLIRKKYAFQQWRSFDKNIYASILRDAEANIAHDLPPLFFGSDNNKRQIAIAKENARHAGVGKMIAFKTADFFETTPPEPPGLVLMNPPYGERMPLADLAAFSKKIGDCFKQNYSGYKAALITGDLHAVKHLGLRTAKRTTLYNGAIESRLLQYDLYEGSRKKKYQND